MKNGMSAKRLRVILLISMLLIIVAIASGFLFVQRNLHDYATTISRLNADAQSGDKNVQTLSAVEQRLAEEQDTIAAARSIVADQATYTDQVINDISRIASESGVTITSLEFAKEAAASAPTTTPTATPGQPTAPTATTSAPAGVIKKSVTVSLQSPLPYSNLLSFIQKVETNNLKMQLTGVTINKDQASMVTTQTFTIEVYVRQ